MDLALLVDVSAVTDATHLAMARTLIELVLAGPRDDRVVLPADLDACGAGRQDRKEEKAADRRGNDERRGRQPAFFGTARQGKDGRRDRRTTDAQ